MTRANTWTGGTRDLTSFNATAGTCAISTSVTRNGIASLRVNPSGAGSGYADMRGLGSNGASADLNLATPYKRYYVRFDTIPASGSEEFLVLLDSASTRKMSYRVHSDGTISAWDSTGTTQLGSNSTAAVSAGNGKWYQFQAHAGSGASAAYELRLRLDGSATLDDTAILSGTSSSIGGNLTALLLGKVINRNSNSVDFYYSDVAIDDTTWPGWGIGGVQLPNSVGHYNDPNWVTGAGGGVDLWELNDETPNDGSTSYMISDATPDTVVTFGLFDTASVGISGEILSVKAIAFSRRHGVANGAYRLRTRINSFDHDGPADFPTGNAFAHRSYVMTTNPEDSQPFELADLDSMELGAVEKSASQASRITLVLAEVEYAPPTSMTGHAIGKGIAAALMATVGSLVGVGSSASAAAPSLSAVGVLAGTGVSVSAEHSSLDLIGVLQGVGVGISAARGAGDALGALEGRGVSVSASRGDGDSVAAIVGHGRGVSSWLADYTLGIEMTGHGVGGSAGHGVLTSAAIAPAGFYESTANLARARASTLTLAPVVYDNQPDGAKPQDAAWIGLTVDFEGTDQVLIGNQYRATGSARFGVRVPASLGDRDALRIADEIRATFTGVSEGSTGSFADIIYDAPEIELGEVEGNWWRMDVAVPFRRDRTQAPQASSGGFPALEAVGNIARTRFKAHVTDEHPCVTLWENQPGDIPTTSPWAHFSVRNDRIEIVQVGPPNRYRVYGTATAMLFAAPSEGDRDSLQLADRIDIAFRAVTDQGVTFETPEVHSIGLERGWWRINVRCPFYSEFFVS